MLQAFTRNPKIDVADVYISEFRRLKAAGRLAPGAVKGSAVGGGCDWSFMLRGGVLSKTDQVHYEYWLCKSVVGKKVMDVCADVPKEPAVPALVEAVKARKAGGANPNA